MCVVAQDRGHGRGGGLHAIINRCLVPPEALALALVLVLVCLLVCTVLFLVGAAACRDMVVIMVMTLHT